jgi:hypothetical protein
MATSIQAKRPNEPKYEMARPEMVGVNGRLTIAPVESGKPDRCRR